MKGIKELIGSISAAIGKADMPVAILDTHGVLFAGQHLPAHFVPGQLANECHSTPLTLPAPAAVAVQQLLQDFGLTPEADSAVLACHHHCPDGMEVACLTLQGFTLPEVLQTPLTLLQQQLQTLQAANNGLQTIISLQSQVEKTLWARHRQYHAVLENASAAYICLDANSTVVSWNHAATRLLGWSSAEVVGQHLPQVLQQTAQPFSLLHLHSTLCDGHNQTMRSQEWMLHSRDGHELTVEVCTFPHSMDEQHYLNIFLHDITQRKLAQQALEQETRRDMLTGLLNRKGLHEALHQHTQPCAVFFIDIDGFKAVNDQYGHDAGDMLLRQFAERLRHGVRDSDAVARLAGDEFVLRLQGIQAAPAATAIAGKLLRKLSQPYLLAGLHIRIGASIGIYLLADGPQQRPDVILASADRAMYEAKRQGKGRYYLLHEDPASSLG